MKSHNYIIIFVSMLIALLFIFLLLSLVAFFYLNNASVETIQAKTKAINEAKDATTISAVTDTGETRMTGIFIDGQLKKIMVRCDHINKIEHTVFYFNYRRYSQDLIFVEQIFTRQKDNSELLVHHTWLQPSGKILREETKGRLGVIPFTLKTLKQQAQPYYDWLTEIYKRGS